MTVNITTQTHTHQALDIVWVLHVIFAFHSVLHLWRSVMPLLNDICFLRLLIFLFPAVCSLTSFYLFLSLLSAIRFSGTHVVHLSRKGRQNFQLRAYESFLPFESYILTAVRNLFQKGHINTPLKLQFSRLLSRPLSFHFAHHISYVLKRFIGIKYIEPVV